MFNVLVYLISGPFFFFFCGPVPGQAGGAPAAGERPARQSVRAAGRGVSRAGAEQPHADSGQSHCPAQDPRVGLRSLKADLGFLRVLQKCHFCPRRLTETAEELQTRVDELQREADDMKLGPSQVVARGDRRRWRGGRSLEQLPKLRFKPKWRLG